ncbi:cytochrome C [Anaerobacillus alkaliphilus]|uniref:Cytochrome C n=1 Tax=Anaerobacillus alkaliphilus TaxID=1548597 RepID=A0A4Q0VTQ6_9BACI|nr:NapC/NirT family cytochrome c [Anaerobacillus alkaliphilus]RXJ01678.1 cytochrome C [Anaerobacillus alkaliphilus]
MDDHRNEENQLTNENKYWKSLKRVKIATLLIAGIIVLALSLNFGVHATSTSQFCSSCHMMTPQALTWEVSSHSSVECKDCHVAPGIENLVDAKVGGLRELYHTVTDSYVAPIRMPSLIPDESCLRCHNMRTRDVSASGDILIDHQIHQEKEIKCVTCHDGVAHGKISEKRVTYKSDYDRWNTKVAERFMADKKYQRPNMEKCMDCHELRNAPLTCETCHSTEMLPDDHREERFKKGEHGLTASENLMYCESCHSYMSKKVIKEFQEKTHYEKYTQQDANEKKLTVKQYAKTNTFCIDCHSERPTSHKSATFFLKHGNNANKESENCFTCHDNSKFSESPVTKVTCATCHPSSHQREWKGKHPIPISNTQKFDETCLSCHVETTCTKCHTYGNRTEE